MTYTKHEWTRAELITSDKLNNIENGLFDYTFTATDSNYYNDDWVTGYVASSTNSSQSAGAIVNSAGVSEYTHTNYISLQKGDLLRANFQVNAGVAGIAVYDEFYNLIELIQEDYSVYQDLPYVATHDKELVIISNAGVRLPKPSIEIIRNFADNYTINQNISLSKKYGYFIKPADLTPSVSSTYGTSDMIVVRPGETAYFKLFGSSGTSVITIFDKHGVPTSSVAVGGALNKYFFYAGTSEITYIRYTNDFSKLTPSAGINVNNKKLKFGMLGDSYVRGNKTESTVTAYNIASFKLGMTYYNYGKNGGTIASYDGYDADHVPMVIRYTDMGDSLDIVGFEGGRNDYGHNIPIGTDSDTDINTFKGALNVLCEGLIKKYLGKKLFGVPCWPVKTPANSVGATQMDYLEAFVHIVHDIWGIEILDSRSVGVYMNSSDFLSTYTEDGNSISHLNEAGHDKFSHYVYNFVEELI